MASNVVDILKRIRERSLNPKEISTSDRRVCVVYLRLEGCTQEEIAEILKVHRQTIIRDERANRREAAKLVDEIDVKSVAGNLIACARHLIAKTLREKNYALAWKIRKELISVLQSLGYLPRSPEQYHVQIDTFVDLVQLATKKVDAEVIEPGANNKNELPPGPDNSSYTRKKTKQRKRNTPKSHRK
ncbi:unnamed protein product [marine sediment metagenome]|uniref:Uncharacterized protein n=1 Tax=marine sediment metagenome TaxID=412755 RepID=X0T023_9ZZZZ